ncbi:hypothetical protein BHM03_00008673, partial [Ensete ventricosum]
MGRPVRGPPAIERYQPREKKGENQEIRCRSPSTISIHRPWGEEASMRLCVENKLRRSRGCFFSPRGEKERGD